MVLAPQTKSSELVAVRVVMRKLSKAENNYYASMKIIVKEHESENTKH